MVLVGIGPAIGPTHGAAASVGLVLRRGREIEYSLTLYALRC